MGQAIARTLDGQGADEALHWYRSLETAEAPSREITLLGRRGHVIGGDLGDAATARAVVRQAIDALGGSGIVLCNAGMIQRNPFLDITDAEWDRIHGVNLHGYFPVAQEAARDMVVRGLGGWIVMISSTNQAHANPNIAHYVASKGGVMMLAGAMALELAEHAITVNLVAPGTVETDMTCWPISHSVDKSSPPCRLAAPARPKMLRERSPTSRAVRPAMSLEQR
jgi:NAD(P)-dependent dehydrogenase (short-subunit alcohol dehydrogenase family)